MQVFQMVWDERNTSRNTSLHTPPRQGHLHRGWCSSSPCRGWLIWFDVDKCLVRRAYLLEYALDTQAFKAPATQTFEPHIGCQKCQQWGIIPLSPRYTGVCSQQLSAWARLAGSWLGNMQAGGYLSTDYSRVKPLLTYRTFIVQHHQYTIITSIYSLQVTP